MRNEDMSNLNSNADAQDSEETIANNQDAGRAPVVIRPGAIRVEADANGMVALPPEVALGDIAVVGTDLVIELPDGTQWVIVDGAVFVPQLMIGDVEVPPTNLAALLIGEEPEPAAGQNQSSGGNFTVAVPDLGPPQPLGDLLPPTALDYTPPEPDLAGQFLEPEEPDNIPDIVIETENNPTGAVNATADVNESGLPAGPGLDGARGPDESEGSAASGDGETTTGTFVYFSPDTPNVLAVDGLVVNGVVVTGPGQVIEGQYGFLTIIATRDGEIDFEYTLTDNTNGDNTSDDFSVTVTDADGDTATATLSINIFDDVPVARDDTDYIAPGGMAADGNVMTGQGTTSGNAGADTEGADGATVVDASGDGSTSMVGGAFVVVGMYGTLTLNADGSYTYARDPLSKGGVEDVFTYTLEDGDGDQSTATLTIEIDNLGDSIDINPDPNGGDTVDESGLPAGPGVDNDRDPDEPEGTQEPTNVETATGTITWVDGDGINVIRINDVIVTGPGQEIEVEGGILTIISYDPDANVIEYSYTLTDNTSGDDTSISFTVTVTDADGDVASDTVTIKIVDDEPVANDDVVNVAPADQNDPVVVDVFANDVEGADGVELSTIQYVDGTLSGSGTLVNNGDGTFTYTPSAGEEGTVTFEYSIEDGDGDVDTALVTINLPADDTPVAGRADALAADEDSLGGANNDEGQMAPDPVEVDHMEALSGTVSVTFGADVPADLMDSFAFLDANEAALDAAGWTSAGDPITWTVSADGHTLTGSAGGSAVIIVSLDSATLTDAATGEVTYGYSVELLDVVDHIDSDLEDTLSFNVSFNVSDSDGDMLAGNPSFSVSVYDDVHSAGDADVSQANENAPVYIDITTDLEEGADGVDLADVTVSWGTGDQSNLSYNAVTGVFTYTPTPGEEGTVSFSYTIYDGDGDAITRDVSFDLTDSQVRVGPVGDVTVDEDGLNAGDEAGEVDPNDDSNPLQSTPQEFAGAGVDQASNTIVVEFGGDVPGDLMGAFSFINVGALNGVYTQNGEDIVFSLSGDGDTIVGQVNGVGAPVITIAITGVSTPTAGGQVTYTYTVDLDGPMDQIDGNNDEGGLTFDVDFRVTEDQGENPEDFAEGSFSVTVEDDVHTVGDAIITQVNENDPVTFVIDNGLVEGADGVDLSEVTWNLTSGNLANFSYDDNGTFTYTPSNGETGLIEFTYTVYDNDGDFVTKTVEFNISDRSPEITGLDNAIVDEDGFGYANDDGDDIIDNDGTELPGGENLVFQDNFQVDFFADNPGANEAEWLDAIEFTANALTALNGYSLESGSDPITFSFLGGDTDIIVGTINGGATEVLRIEITGASAGADAGKVIYEYTVTLSQPIDHPVDLNPTEMALVLNGIEIQVEDSDGSVDDATFSVSIYDDVPTAENDGNTELTEDAVEGGVTSTADNGLDNVFDNDIDGADGGEVANPGTQFGMYGNLLLDSAGNYEYVLTQAGIDFMSTLQDGETFDEVFNYTLIDGDGDTDVATLTITLTGSDDPVSIGGTLFRTVDEDDLATSSGNPAGGADGEAGGSDGSDPTTISGSISITADDGVLNLSIGGVALVVNGVVQAPAGAQVTALGNSVTFTYDEANGEIDWEYTLLDNEDHPTGQDENDTNATDLVESFTINLEDTDNDMTSDSLDIRIVDDVPTAVNDGAGTPFAVAYEGSVDIDAFANDDFGADGVDITDDSVSVQFTQGANGTVTYDTGTGLFTYQANDDFYGTDSFTYTITDADGDPSLATVYVDVDSAPQLDSVENAIVDEDGLGDEAGEPDANDDQNPLQSDPVELAGTGSDESTDNEIVVDFGNDLPVNPLAAFSWFAPASLNGQLTQGGTDIEFTANGAVLEGRVGGVGDPVITITVSVGGTAGSEVTYHYDVDLDGPVDQTSYANGDDSEAIANAILSGVQFQVTDSDGTMLETPGSLSVSIWDDVPQITFNDLEDAGDTLTTTDVMLPSDDDTLFVSDMLTHNALYGADGAGAADSVVYGIDLLGAGQAQANDAGVASGLSSGGDPIYLYEVGDAVVGSTDATFDTIQTAANAVFIVSVDPSSGQVTLDQLQPIDHYGAEPLPFPGSLIEATLEVTIVDGDGDSVTASEGVDLGGNLLFGDDAPTSVGNGANNIIALDESLLPPDGDGEWTLEVDFSGSFDTPIDFGNDGPADNVNNGVNYALEISDGGSDGVFSGLYALDTSDTTDAEAMNPDGYGQGAAIMLYDVGGVIYGSTAADDLSIDPDNTYFIISVDSAGLVSFTRSQNIWHGDTGFDDEAGTIVLSNGDSLVLRQTVTDYDNDSATSTVDLNGVFSIQDDGPVVNDYGNAEDNTDLEGSETQLDATGVFDYFIGTDTPDYASGQSDFSSLSLSMMIGGSAATVTQPVLQSEDATQATFSFTYEYDDGPLTVGDAFGTGTITFDKANGEYTVAIDPIESFSFSTTQQGTQFIGYDEGTSNIDNSGLSDVAVTELKAGELYVQFRGSVEGNGNNAAVWLKAGGDFTYTDGELVLGPVDGTVSSSGSDNGVNSDTMNKGEVLDMNFYTSNPEGFDVGTTGQAQVTSMFFQFFGVKAQTDAIIVLKLYDPGTDTYTTRALYVGSEDFRNATELNGTDYESLGSTLGNDEVVIIEPNDFNNDGENYVIVGAQIMSMNGSGNITGDVIDFNGLTGAGGDSLDGMGDLEIADFSDDGNDTGFKITNIGLLTEDATAQDAVLTFDAELTDADGDVEDPGSFSVTFSESSTNTLSFEKIALAANDDFVMAELNESQSLMMSSAIALGFAATLPAKFSWGDAGIAEAAVMDLAAYDVPSFTSDFGSVDAVSGVTGFEGGVIGSSSDALSGQTTFVAAKEAIDVSLDAIELPVEAPSAPKADTVAVAEKIAIVDAGEVILPGAEALAAMIAKDAGSVDLAVVAKEALVDMEGGEVDALLAKFGSDDAGAPDAVATLMVVGKEAIGTDDGGYVSANFDALLTDAANMHQDAAIAVVNG